MKNPWEWDKNDLLEMVNAGTQESIQLDFKESKALLNVKGQKDVRYEISKDVSALANSAGGTLIYGIAENGHVATGLDMGNDPTVVTKEWLQQIINSTIHRKIDGVRVNQVALTAYSPGNVAYVVYVPQSMRTPHQALDKRFYKRYEFESVAMEEYEIRDLYRRGEVPDLRIEFVLPKTELRPIAGTAEFEPFSLQTTITNEALEPAHYAVIKLYIDARLDIVSAQGLRLSVTRNSSIFIGDEQFPATVLQVYWTIPERLPIFNEEFGIIDVLLLKPFTDGRMGKTKYYLVGYEIKSPQMPTKSSFAHGMRNELTRRKLLAEEEKKDL